MSYIEYKQKLNTNSPIKHWLLDLNAIDTKNKCNNLDFGVGRKQEKMVSGKVFQKW